MERRIGSGWEAARLSLVIHRNVRALQRLDARKCPLVAG